MAAMERLEIVEGDITRLQVDAIVNAANSTLLGGAGVDGAIHQAAGPRLLEECESIGGCPTGEARVTKGYNLPARYIIHTVGPVWRDGEHGEDELLAACYRNSLALAARHDINTIAFPAISTGVYRFPLERATRIAITEATRFVAQSPAPGKIWFVCFGPAARRSYEAVLGEVPS